MSISAKEFRRLMHCGHGRCFSAMEEGNPEIYRKAVLYGCLHDIAYDMQCEGSRGIFMYNLAQYYPDADSFADAAAERFRKLPPDMEEHLFQHLCDFLLEFAADKHPAANAAFGEQYAALYHGILTTRQSRKRNRMLTNYEYFCILITQLGEPRQFLRMLEHIGSMYLQECISYRDIGWLMQKISDAEERMALLQQMQGNDDLSNLHMAFLQLVDDAPLIPSRLNSAPFLCPEEVRMRASFHSLTPAHRRTFARLATDEMKTELAQMACCVSDGTRPSMWMMFDTKYNPFPLPPDKLLADAVSENEELRQSARAALCHVQNPAVHTFAKQLLAEEPLCPGAIRMLIANYQPEDEALFRQLLHDLPVDLKEESEWHSIMISILNHADRLPDAAFSFIYENSFCSCCRESALCNMQERNMLTPEIQWECAHDCNPDIRETYGKAE